VSGRAGTIRLRRWRSVEGRTTQQQGRISRPRGATPPPRRPLMRRR